MSCGRRSRGFAGTFIVLALLGLLMMLGLAFSSSSRQTGLGVLTQVDTLRARALARAGLAKALLVLRRQLEAHRYGWTFPDQRVGRLPAEEFEGKLGDGRFRVVSVEPLRFRRGDRTIGPYRNRPYRIHGEALGYYDVVRIVTEGTIPRTSTGVRMTTLVKTVRRRVLPP